MLWLRIQNTPQFWKVNVWVGREKSFQGYCSAPNSFLYKRKITECCKTQHNQLIYLGTNWFSEREKKKTSGKKSHIWEYTRNNPPVLIHRLPPPPAQVRSKADDPDVSLVIWLIPPACSDCCPASPALPPHRCLPALPGTSPAAPLHQSPTGSIQSVSITTALCQGPVGLIWSHGGGKKASWLRCYMLIYSFQTGIASNWSIESIMNICVA